MWKTSRLFLDCNPLDNTLPDFQMVVRGSGSLDRLEVDQLALGQLHWSTANYAPFQEQALWDGLIAVYEQVSNFFKHLFCQFTLQRTSIRLFPIILLNGFSTAS
jgi:hypothetical protein